MDTIKRNIILATDFSNMETSQSSNLIRMTLTALRINLSKSSQATSTLTSSESSVFTPLSNLEDLNLKKNVLPIIPLQDVSYHDSFHDCWIVLYDRVYDVTKFLDKHPGGEEIILEYAGRDATIAFRGTGHSKMALSQLQEYLIGELPSDERIYRNNNSSNTFLFQLSDIPD